MGDGGRIVLVSSTAGQRGEAFHADYAASKGAMISLMKSLAVELAPRGITVNCVAPGWVDTEMVARRAAGGGRARIAAAFRSGASRRADDIAGPIVFLCSALARHVTGEILNVNGGSVLVRMIVLLFTGGTISMRFDAERGGAVPSLPARIVDAARGHRDVADVELEQWGRFPGRT